MTPYRVEFHAKGAAETIGLPAAAFTALYEELTTIARDPWRRTSPEDLLDDQTFRWTSFGNGLGVVYVMVDDQTRVVRVHGVTWTG